MTNSRDIYALSEDPKPRNGVHRSAARCLDSDEAANFPCRDSAAKNPLDEEIARAEAAYQLMVVADTCLKNGADRLLLLLGFTALHVAELRAQAGPAGGYPAYSLRNIRSTLRYLRRERERDDGSR